MAQHQGGPIHTANVSFLNDFASRYIKNICDGIPPSIFYTVDVTQYELTCDYSMTWTKHSLVHEEKTS